ncbi:MAG: DUF5723 family protein [Ferruginibacter sp.]
MRQAFFTVAVIFFCASTEAQKYYGIANSNYAGINGLYINPANAADNRMLGDIHLISGNGAINQNYGYLSSFKNLTNSIQYGTDINFIKNSNSDNVGFAALGEVRGPSFMFQIEKKQAVGFLSRGRVVGSARGINSNLFTLLNDGVENVEVANGTSFSSGKANTTINAFTELGIVYGREILNERRNYLKAGITLKRYNGIEFSSIQFKDFNIKILDTAISRVEFNGVINASKSLNFENDEITSKNLFFGGKGGGFGVDIGAVYEYRDEEPVSTLGYENKYKFKIGFAIQDLGSMRYKASASNENYVINTNGPKVANMVDTAYIEFDDVTSYFRTIPGVTATKDNGSTKVQAPTTFTLYGDYRFGKRIYLNALFTSGLVSNKNPGNKTGFQAIVTPRYESKFLDAGLPISYNGLSKDVKVGVGLRLGILFFGSDDILSTAAGIGKLTGSNAYAGLHAGIPHKKPKKRKQKEEVLPEPLKEVEVKTQVIIVPLDTDKDGIIDTEDNCPTVFGLAAFKGCSDTDSDGIEDSKDKCPTVFGIAAFNGCPDTDADGLQDSEDECSTEKGVIALKGCPDKDGDGVADKNDKCADRPGPIENAGCPIITKEIKSTLNFAAQFIQFEVGKDIIKKISYSQLDEVVKILKEYEDYTLKIDGHTDNTGTAEKNKILSEKRAQAVKTYFVQKGIVAGRLKAIGYGFDKPIAPNDSPANRAKNRRVELTME